MAIDPAYSAAAHDGIGSTYYLEARASVNIDDYEHAIEEYSTAIDAEPEFLRALSNRGHVYFETQQYSRAVRDYAAAVIGGYERLAETVPDAHRTYRNYGTALRLLNEPEEAIVQYRQAADGNPGNAYYDVALALAYLDAGQVAEADECLTRVREYTTDPDSWEGRFVRCLLLELSPEELIDAAEGDDAKCEAYYYAGEAFLRMGEREEAMRAFRQCTEQCESTGRTRFTEYRWAKWRLGELDGTSQGIACSFFG
jgi:tetratricopeptide (TPR) repeat protein